MRREDFKVISNNVLVLKPDESVCNSPENRVARKKTLRETMDEFERGIIIRALCDARGNMAQAARDLGITERIMGLRVNKYRLCTRNYQTTM